MDWNELSNKRLYTTGTLHKHRELRGQRKRQERKSFAPQATDEGSRG